MPSAQITPAVANRLLQVLRGQVSRSTASWARSGFDYHVSEGGSTLPPSMVARLEAEGLIKWSAVRLSDTRSTATLTSAGEAALRSAPRKKVNPNDGQAVCQILLSLVRRRMQDSDKELAEAVAAQRWSEVAGLNGIGTGLAMAEKTIRDELLSLQRSQPATRRSMRRKAA